MKLHLEHLPAEMQLEFQKLLNRYDAAICADEVKRLKDEVKRLKDEIDVKQKRIDHLVKSFMTVDSNDQDSFLEKIAEWQLTEYVNQVKHDIL